MSESSSNSESPQFVYALGRISPQYPNLGTEKEMAQLIGRSGVEGLTDRATIHEVLSQPENRYLPRSMCWLFRVEGLETFILHPRDSSDFELLVAAIRPNTRDSDVDVVIGLLGPIAHASMYAGVALPVVFVDQIYSFDIDSFLNEMPRPEGATLEEFNPIAEELFSRVMQDRG